MPWAGGNRPPTNSAGLRLPIALCYSAGAEDSFVPLGGVSVWEIAWLESGVFLDAVRDRIVFACGLFKAARFTGFDPAASFEAVFFGTTRALLGVADFAGATLAGFGFLGGAGFAPALLVGDRRFGAGVVLDELLAGGPTRAAVPAVDFFWVFDTPTSECCRAQRARCAAATLAFPSGLIPPRLGALTSLGVKLVPLFLEPFGRPRLGAVLGARRPATAPAGSSPPSKLRTCVRREISSSMAEDFGGVHFNPEYDTAPRRPLSIFAGHPLKPREGTLSASALLPTT